MAFGQPAGPPASAKRVQLLLSLLQAAGHSDFRDARGPMGFTQRQAAGRFTRDEVEAFIELLEQGTDTSADHDPAADGDRPASVLGAVGPSAAAAGVSSARRPLSTSEQALRTVPSPVLAAELQRRGWVVMQP